MSLRHRAPDRAAVAVGVARVVQQVRHVAGTRGVDTEILIQAKHVGARPNQLVVDQALAHVSHGGAHQAAGVLDHHIACGQYEQYDDQLQ